MKNHRAHTFQILKFAFSGAIGFLVESIFLYGLVKICGFDLYTSKLLGFFAAVTTTWWLNRNLTFADRRNVNLAKEWFRYVVANGFGGLINNLLYGVLVTVYILFSRNPILAVAIGSLVGMISNYLASDRYVFKKASCDSEPIGAFNNDKY